MSSQPIIGWVTIQVDDKFVRHTREEGPFNNCLKASAKKAVTPYTKFYLEPSATHEGLVHIRSGYNHRYWVPKKVNDSWYIIVDAEVPEEDKAQPSCTLFELTVFMTLGEGFSAILNHKPMENDPSIFRIIPHSSMFEHVEDGNVRMFLEQGYKVPYLQGCLGRTEQGCLSVTGDDQGLKFRVINLDTREREERERILSQPIIGWVAIKVDDKFVRHMSEHGPFNNVLKTSGDKALTPYTRFYLEPSTEHERLVHIRSCYNNKYWVPKEVNKSWYIFVDAKEPEEDKAQPSCTLFELQRFNDWKTDLVDPSAFWIIPCSSIFENVEDTTVRSMFEEEGFQTKLKDYPPGCLGRTKEGCLFVTGVYQGLKFSVITLDDEKALPTYVRFKGDNDKYLGSDGVHVSRFIYTDGNDSRVIHTIDTSPDGSFIRIKSESSGKYWRCKPEDWNWIAPDSSDDKDKNTWFEVVRLGGNVIALKNIGNGKFAKRYDAQPNSNGFSANIDSAEVYAQLKLEEAVVDRKIYNVHYHLDAAKLYDQKALVMATAHSVNCSNTETTAKLNLKYSVANTSSWSKTTTETWGVNASFHAGLPAVNIGIEGLFSIGITPDLGFSVGGNYEHTYTEEYGGTHTRTEEQSVDYDMKVPPRTKMTLRAIATQVSYDIPYSYIQKDVLANGRRLITMGDDGLFQGVSCHEYTYKVTEEKLADDEKATE